MRKIPKILRIIVAAISLSMGLLAFSFLSQWGRVNPWAAWQLGPNMAKMFAAFTVSAVVVVGFWLALAFVFGRFYCSAICPIGIMQDIIGSFSRWKKRHPAANYRKTRYAIALVAFGMMAGGSVLVFAVLDPFSIFGRMAIGIFNPALIVVENTWVRMLLPWQPVTDWLPIAVGAILPLAILIALVIWKKRIFCTAVCPVGTVLGVCSRRGVVRLGINENRCKGCGLCAKVCPVDCIDAKARTLDNERCVRCMNCIAACKLSAVCFTCKRNKAHKSRATDLSRRNFLMGGTLALTAAGAGYGLKSRTVPENRLSIYPPGAGSAARFKSKCTTCGLCIAACRGNVIRPPNRRARSIHLDFQDGMCQFHCKRCIDVCPTGALRSMKLAEKRRTRIGMAELFLEKCIPYIEGTDCGACAEQCPTGAMHMVTDSRGVRIPALRPGLCIGCGGCENACPVQPKPAVIVHPVQTQVQADDPRKYRLTGPNAGPAGDEWLF